MCCVVCCVLFRDHCFSCLVSSLILLFRVVIPSCFVFLEIVFLFLVSCLLVVVRRVLFVVYGVSVDVGCLLRVVLVLGCVCFVCRDMCSLSVVCCVLFVVCCC